MAVNLSPVGGVAAQFFTNNGVILSGGKIYTYTAGTTTNQATYTSSNGGTAHTNPIILDSAGRVPSGEIWLTDGLQYKFVLKDANDVLIGTYDNIIGINSNFVNFTNEQEIQTATAGQTVFTLTTMQYQPATGSLSVFVDGVNQYGPGAQYAYIETNSTVVTFVSGLHVGASVKFTTSSINASSYGTAFDISYTPPFTASVATNVGDKLAQTVSVTDFGAVGDGTTNDTAAIQAAITAATSAGAELVFPAGTYKHTTALTFTCNVQGYGMPRIKSSGNIKSVIVTNSYGYFKGIRIEPDGTGTTSNDGLTIAGGARTLFENVLVLSCGNDGIVFDSTTNSNNIASLNNVQSRLNGRDGIRIALGGDNNACLLSNIDVSSNTANGITLTGICVGTVFNNVAAQNNGAYGIAYLGATCRNNIGTAYLESNTTGDVYFDATAHTNMLWLSNDGNTRLDSNGTNTILSASSGSTQRYNFNKIDFSTFRIYNTVDVGQLEFSQPSDRQFAFTTTGSGSAFGSTFAKGAASAHSLSVEGSVLSTTSLYPSSPTSNSQIISGAGSPEGAVTAIRGSLFMRNDGGAGTSLYVKESGAGNTGWAAK